MTITINKYIDLYDSNLHNMILAPTGNLGISRDKMPQIDDKHRDKFLEYLTQNGVSVRYIRVPAKSLKMVQGEYDRDKVVSMIKSGGSSLTPILVSIDGYVLDGNHRLIAQLNLPAYDKTHKSTYVNVIALGSYIHSLLDITHKFPGVRYRNSHDSVV